MRLYNENNMKKQRGIIITGPTASGKSDFAHRLARKIGGTIINCDSVQLYRGIETISASPFAGRAISDEIDGVPYRLFSILDLSRQLNVADYQELARHEYDNAIGAGRIPIFVGGTGYYIDALINGISPMPAVSDTARARARELVASDIDAARKILPSDFRASDPQRVARALEVFFETGKHLSAWQRAPRTGQIAPTPLRILINPPSDVVRARIATRINQMMDGDAINEAREILNHNLNENRAIGAVQICRMLRGEVSRQECITDWVNKTNQYAKRQRTWFRSRFSPDIRISNFADFDKVIYDLCADF